MDETNKLDFLQIKSRIQEYCAQIKMRLWAERICNLGTVRVAIDTVQGVFDLKSRCLV